MSLDEQSTFTNYNTTVFDFETAGIDNNCVIFTLSAVKFNRYDPSGVPLTVDELLQRSDKLDIRFNVAEQLMKGRVVEASCIEDFWGKLPKKVVSAAIRSGCETRVAQGLDEFFKFSEGTTLFCRGTDFEPPKLASLCKQFNVELPVKYNKFRDVRSYIDALTGKDDGVVEIPNTFVTTPHISLDDCLSDSAQMIKAYQSRI